MPEMTISSHLIIMQSSTLDQHAVEKLDSQRSSKTDLSPYEDVLSYYSLAFLKRNTKVVQSRGQIKAASGQQKMQFYGCYHNSISIQVCKTHVKVVGFAIKSCQGTGYVKYESRKYFYESIQTIQNFKSVCFKCKEIHHLTNTISKRCSTNTECEKKTVSSVTNDLCFVKRCFS